MARPLSVSDESSLDGDLTFAPGREPASPTVQWVGWGVWTFLAFVGFCFGVWAGTPQAAVTKPVEVAAVTPAPSPAPPVPTPKPEVKPVPTPAAVAKVETPTKPEPPTAVAVVAPTPKPEVMTPEPKPEVKPEPPPVPKPEVKPVPKPPEPKKPDPAVAKVAFKDVLPVFRAKCISCHNSGKPKYDLDLSTLAAVNKGGAGGPVVKPGNPKDSTLWTSVEEDSMPKNPPFLTADEKKLLQDWILGGAK